MPQSKSEKHIWLALDSDEVGPTDSQDKKPSSGPDLKEDVTSRNGEQNQFCSAGYMTRYKHNFAFEKLLTLFLC